MWEKIEDKITYCIGDIASFVWVWLVKLFVFLKGEENSQYLISELKTFCDKQLVFFSAEYNAVHFLDSCIWLNTDLDRKNDKGDTPLILACRRGSNRTIKLLLDHGADTELTDIYGLTAFENAMKGFHFNTMKLLLEYDIMIFPDSRKNDYDLNIPIVFEKFNLVELLLKAGVNPNYTSKNIAPLHAAVAERKYKLIELLLEHGADANIKDSKGRTPIVYCTNHKLRNILLKYGAK